MITLTAFIIGKYSLSSLLKELVLISAFIANFSYLMLFDYGVEVGSHMDFHP